MKNEDDILNRLRDAVVNLDVESAKKACQHTLAARMPPYKAMMEGLSKGMQIVGDKYRSKEFFLGELIMAGEVMKEGMEILEPHMGLPNKGVNSEHVRARVVIGSVQGDLHDIGKNIVITLLRAAGFQVYDLGVDVSVREFVETVRSVRPDILAMSALLSVTMPQMKKVIDDLEREGLRDGVKIILGGAPISQEYADEIGADAGTKNAVEGVDICKRFISSS